MYDSIWDTLESNVGVKEVIKGYYGMENVRKLLLNPIDIFHIEPHWRPGTRAGKPLKPSRFLEVLNYLELSRTKKE